MTDDHNQGESDSRRSGASEPREMDLEVQRLQAAIEDIKNRLNARIVVGDGLDEFARRSVGSLIADRKRRNELFPDGLFSDPAWDILLELCLAETEHRRLAVTRLATASGLAEATANRWIEKLERCRLVQRQRDPTDRRRVFVGLTPLGQKLLSAYFTKT